MTYMNDSCNIHLPNGSTFGITSGYSGIPANLAINVIYFAISIVIFLCIRVHIADQDKTDTKRKVNVVRLVTNPRTISDLEIQDFNPFTVIWKTMTLSLSDIGKKCGPDSTRYLFFQYHAIIYCAILLFISIVVILPVNLQGTMHGNSSYFGFSTISNLEAGSPLLWVHIFMCLLGTIIGFIIMIHFIKLGDITGKRRKSDITLMIRMVRPEWCEEALFKSMLRQMFPTVEIVDVTIAYKVWRLSKTVAKCRRNKMLLEACGELEEEDGNSGVIYRSCCGYTCTRMWCACCCKTIEADNARVYYEKIDNDLQQEINEATEEALNEPTGIVFVTLADKDTAANVMASLKKPKSLEGKMVGLAEMHQGEIPTEIISAHQIVNEWKCRWAPLADNLLWENIRERNFSWYFRVVILNACLLWLSIVLSTPSMVLTVLDKILSTSVAGSSINSILPVFIVNILPPLMLKAVSRVLPPVIGHSAHLERHLTRSRKAKYHINKAFYFLLFTVLIIPSLGLTGLDGLMRFIFQVDTTDFKWECIFLPDNGAFYVNYVITSALMGESSSLLRLPELISVGFSLLFCRSKAEVKAVYKLERTEFPYCSAYAEMLVVIAVITSYHVICPIIIVFGLLYLVLKHFVDKYNIYFTSTPTLVKQRIHLSAFKASLLCVILPEIILLIFMTLKAASINNGLLIVQGILTGICILLYLLERTIGLERVIGQVVSPLMSTVPSMGYVPGVERELAYTRYYAHFLLPYVNEKTGRESAHFETSSLQSIDVKQEPDAELQDTLVKIVP